MVFAMMAALALMWAGDGSSIVALLVAIGGVQGRLLCNLMDGMVAVEGQRGGRFGELYNEIPDRVSDILILLGAGYGYRAHEIFWFSPITFGWVAALLAVLTAYVRLCGVSVGAGHIFVGPMAKPHRMALISGACAVEVACLMFDAWFPLTPIALIVMIIGCLATLTRRVRKITEYLEGL
jgi:phosphatidylglycerophosphate synthase